MLTDIFVVRYEQKILFKEFARREARILHQCFTMLQEMKPVYGAQEKVRKENQAFWQEVHNRIANELGEKYLFQPYYTVERGIGEHRHSVRQKREYITVCENWLSGKPTITDNIDEFLKERISLIEVAFRLIYDELEARRKLFSESSVYSVLKTAYEIKLEKYNSACVELNYRFASAKYPLNYHNGFIQLEVDELLSLELEQPFWSLVSDDKWENVDIDIKEAIDRRDGGGKDPALHAAKALESILKIISSDLGVTHGGEKGAHNYIDNLGSRNTGFINSWEKEWLKDFFTKIRNPLGHGPGYEPMPVLSEDQSSWAIEQVMSWAKLLIRRLENWAGEVK